MDDADREFIEHLNDLSPREAAMMDGVQLGGIEIRRSIPLTEALAIADETMRRAERGREAIAAEEAAIDAEADAENGGPMQSGV